MTIKTWQEIMKPEFHGITGLAVQFMQAEINELRAENAALLAANLDCILHYEDSRTELEKLKQQEPVGYAYEHQDFVGSIIGSKGQWAPHEIPLYLAAGSKPPKVLMHQLTNDKVKLQTKLDAANTELDKLKQQEPVQWWNGFRKYDERDLTGPSFSAIETPYHDIPLIAGWNPVHLAAGASK